MNPQHIQQTLDTFVAKADPIWTAQSLATWHYATTGEEQYKQEQVELSVEAHKLYEGVHDDLPTWDDVQQLYATRDGFDADLRRQVEILYRMFLVNQSTPEENEALTKLSVEVQSIYTNHRAVIVDSEGNGEKVSDNEIADILRTATDEAEREAAWLGSKSIGPQVADMVRELGRQRNAIAQRLGFRDHYAFSLQSQEIDEAQLFDLFDRLDEQTREPFRRIKDEIDSRIRDRLGLDENASAKPWWYANPFFQSAPAVFDVDPNVLFEEVDIAETSVRAYDALGMEVRDVLDRSDLYEREGKNQHAFCTRIGRGDDTRILCNLRPTARWMMTQMHELGHAVYNKYVPMELPYLLRSYAHISSTEASAMLLGGLVANAEWLDATLDIDEAMLADLRGELDRQRAAGLMIFVRWVLVMLHFERAFYADPARDDLDALWWELVERYQLIEKPAGRNEPDWATKYHVAMAPVYYHNYILGELTASQLARWIEAQSGSLVGNPEAGRLLIDQFYAHGARYAWDKLIEVTTGEPLQPDYFVQQHAGTI